MPSAGKYPIVRGAGTLPRFFEAVSRQATPTAPFATLKWLRASGLTSSYFNDVPAFASFIGMTDDDGPTELWVALRDEASRAETLAEALRTAYGEPLRFHSIETPDSSTERQLSSFIKTHEGTSSELADDAVRTLVAAFDFALGRNAKNPADSGRTAVASNGSRRGRPSGLVSKSSSLPKQGESGKNFTATLAVNLQIVLPADAPDEKYDAMLGAVARHLSPLLKS